METCRDPELDCSGGTASDAGARSGQAPARQRPYETALEVGFDALLSRAPSDSQLAALGVERRGGRILAPVLGGVLAVDTEARDVFVEDGDRARQEWAILVVHYVSAGDVPSVAREVAFGSFADCRGYFNVFAKRIIGRFLATAGRTSEHFAKAAEQLGAERLPGRGIGYRFAVLPRVPITLVRYDGDEEIGPGASVTYRADAESLLPAEDRVVAVELLLDALSGKGIEESPGGTG